MSLGLARVPIMRLVRSRRARLHVLAWSALAIVGAILGQKSGAPNAADQLMRGSFGYVFVPLLAYGIVSAAYAGTGLRPSLRGLVAIGGSPRRAAVASVLVAALASAFACALLGVLVCALAHGPADPPLARDLPVSFGVAWLGGAAYATYFSVGSAFGRGAMRGGFLVIDWLLGAPAGFGALFTPRAHLTSLLGGPPCFVFSRPASSVALVLLIVVYFALAVRLGRRPLRS